VDLDQIEKGDRADQLQELAELPKVSKTAEHEFAVALKLLHSEARPNRALRNAALHYVKRTNGSSGHELSE